MTDLRELAADALRLPGCDAVEVGLSRTDLSLTRFAESRIHQNVARASGTARVRVVVDGSRIGIAVTSELDPAAIAATAEQARQIARVTPHDPEFAGLAPGGLQYAAAGRDDDATAHCTPAERAAYVRTMLQQLPPDSIGAGFVETGRVEQAVVNTFGVAAVHAGTRVSADILASGADSTGNAEAAAPALSGVDFAELGRRAATKVTLGRQPRDVEPGEWPVVLEPTAVATLVEFLAFTAMGGKDYNDGQSAFSGRLGESVCGTGVTIVDDALHNLLPGEPFDAEGTAKRRLPLVQNGVAAAVTHDRATARTARTTSTGHALPPPNPYGPYPSHLVMLPGDASTDDLVSGCERGVYVSRFHYTNVVHPKKTLITGMTRDGTFLIEHGRIVAGVRNLRFTQSLLDALSTLEQRGNLLEVTSEVHGSAVAAPAVRLGRFRFTSGTAQ